MEPDLPARAEQPAPSEPAAPVLEYAAPAPGISAGRIFAAVCSIPAFILGLPFLLTGAFAVFHSLTEQHLAYRHEDAFFGLIMVAIGVTCLYAAIRWACEGFFGKILTLTPPLLRQFLRRRKL